MDIYELLRCLCMSCTLFAGFSIVALYYVYEVFEEGVLVLENAPGIVTIAREADTKIMHIKGDTWKSIAYG